jgi:hypothetical protein
MSNENLKAAQNLLESSLSIAGKALAGEYEQEWARLRALQAIAQVGIGLLEAQQPSPLQEVTPLQEQILELRRTIDASAYVTGADPGRFYESLRARWQIVWEYINFVTEHADVVVRNDQKAELRQRLAAIGALRDMGYGMPFASPAEEPQA